jgi:MtN3 and saliva related transmembrane protein
MDIIAMIGLGAAALSTVSLLPQIVRVWKTKSVKDISTGWCGFTFSSVSLWLLYGVLSMNIPIVASNSVVVVQSAAILTFKARYQPGAGAGMFSGNALKLKLTHANKKPRHTEAEADKEIPFTL